MRPLRWIPNLLSPLCLATAAAVVAVMLPAPRAAAAALPAPTAVKGIYVTAWNAADPEKLGELLSLIDRTELNAVVVDVKTDSGQITFATDEATARQAGAVQPYIPDPQAFTADLKARGVYSIARVVGFKDPIMAAYHPDWAVLNAEGTPWQDYNGVSWLNPYNRNAWDYLLRVATAAAEAGFDEIQFDYVRFPTDGDLSAARYPGEDDRLPEQVIADFLAYVRAELAPLGVPLSADVFGLVTSVGDDMGIGQQLEAIAGAADLVSPMLYPSHYERGNLGLSNPNAMPYQTIYRSLEDAGERIELAGLASKTTVRPWLQDFSWGYPYGPDEVRAQTLATCEAGYSGWLLWNPANEYTAAALMAEELFPYAFSACEVGDPAAVALNGKLLAFEGVSPFITRRSGLTMAPLRSVADAMGAAVEWDEATLTARVRLGAHLLQVTLGEEAALVDGKAVALGQPAATWQGSTLVPLRFLAEGLGAQVVWDGAQGRVNIVMDELACRPGYCARATDG